MSGFRSERQGRRAFGALIIGQSRPISFGRDTAPDFEKLCRFLRLATAQVRNRVEGQP